MSSHYPSTDQACRPHPDGPAHSGNPARIAASSTKGSATGPASPLPKGASLAGAPINRIVIEFIPQSQQRYDTCGDWFFKDGTLHIFVSEMPDPRHQQLVSVHELVETLACNVDGVSREAVDEFEMGPGAELAEPGNDPTVPYHQQHITAATAIEQRLAAALGVEWAGALICAGWP